MINDVIKALARALKVNFKDSKKYTIYTENVEQGLKQPCFFIYCNNYGDELYRGKRHRVYADIVIEFIPPKEQINFGTNSVIEELFNITECVELDGNMLSGINRKVENAESGAVFSVRFEYFYYKDDKTDKMEILKERTDING